MLKNFYLVGLLALIGFSVFAQDEGLIQKKERLQRSSGVFITGGPSFTLGKNIGDYNKGFNFEIGFLKRLNRVLSIGPSFSYQKFAYDPDVTRDVGGAYVGYISDVTDPDYYEGYIINLTGGDLSMMSLSFTVKLNFIPVKDDSKISLYGFAKPFLTMAKRADVSGTSVYYRTDDPDGEDDWRVVDDDIEWGPDDYDALKADSRVTGGIFIGPGIEFVPAKAVSFFFQAGFGYSFPVSFVSTESYDPTLDSYFDDEFPMTEEGFPLVNLQFGLNFNF